MRCLLSCWLFITVAGCTSTGKISRTSNEIQANAESSKERFQVLADASLPPPLDTTAVGGIKEQTEIITLTRDIHTYLTGVEDKVPEWLYLLQYGAIAVILLAVCWILFYAGIGPAIRTLLGWIPRKVKRDADLAASMLSGDDPVSPREYVAARRASSQEFDKAYEKSKRTRLTRNHSVLTNARSSSRLGPLDTSSV